MYALYFNRKEITMSDIKKIGQAAPAATETKPAAVVQAETKPAVTESKPAAAVKPAVVVQAETKPAVTESKPAAAVKPAVAESKPAAAESKPVAAAKPAAAKPATKAKTAAKKAEPAAKKRGRPSKEEAAKATKKGAAAAAPAPKKKAAKVELDKTDTFKAAMWKALDHKAAKKVSGDIAVQIFADGLDTFYFALKGGQAEIERYYYEGNSGEIRTTEAELRKVISGKYDLLGAVAAGKLSFGGDLSALVKMINLF